MPEKVTSLNGLKVTLEYGSYNLGAHNKDYVKSNKYIVYYQLFSMIIIPSLPMNLLRQLEKQSPFLGLRCLKTMIKIKPSGFFC